MTTANAPVSAQSSLEDETSASTPRVRTRFAPDEIVARLDAAARKGRLPGFRPTSSRALFEVREIGHPFQAELLAHASRLDSEARTELAFELRIRPLLPFIFALMLALSIWPGIYVVDSMLRQYFSWYTIPTWWWYLPLTVPTSPWAFWSALKKSRAAARAEAAELINKISAELHAETV